MPIKFSTLHLTGAVILSVVFAGCTLMPEYERPVSPVADAWPTASSSSVVSGSDSTTVVAADIPWMEFFGDARLKGIIKLGLENNRDLRTAVLRVEQVQAQYRIQASQLWPELGGDAGLSRARVPADLSSSGRSYTGSEYRVGLTAAYEVDLFGRIRSLKANVLETWLATEEAHRAAHLSLVSTLATQYFTEQATSEQLTLSQQTLELVQASYDLIKSRYENGVATELDLRTVEGQVAAAQAAVAEYTRLHEQAGNALVYLVGAALPDDLPAPAPLLGQNLLKDIPAGLPADLLQRRPDILQAEHLLRAANANIGAARAAFFPSITLTALGGTKSADLDGLFKSGSGAWSFAPQITLPIFTAGRNRANLDVAKLQKEIEIANYEKAIQSAFRDVADGLAARASFGRQLAAQQAQVNAMQSRYTLSDLRYKGGVSDYLTVLTAQQDLFASQQDLIRSRSQHLISLVDLYRALGGGWREKTEDDAESVARMDAVAAPAGAMVSVSN